MDKSTGNFDFDSFWSNPSPYIFNLDRDQLRKNISSRVFRDPLIAVGPGGSSSNGEVYSKNGLLFGSPVREHIRSLDRLIVNTRYGGDGLYEGYFIVIKRNVYQVVRGVLPRDLFKLLWMFNIGTQEDLQELFPSIDGFPPITSIEVEDPHIFHHPEKGWTNTVILISKEKGDNESSVLSLHHPRVDTTFSLSYGYTYNSATVHVLYIVAPECENLHALRINSQNPDQATRWVRSTFLRYPSLKENFFEGLLVRLSRDVPYIASCGEALLQTVIPLLIQQGYDFSDLPSNQRVMLFQWVFYKRSVPIVELLLNYELEFPSSTDILRMLTEGLIEDDLSKPIYEGYEEEWSDDDSENDLETKIKNQLSILDVLYERGINWEEVDDGFWGSICYRPISIIKDYCSNLIHSQRVTLVKEMRADRTNFCSVVPRDILDLLEDHLGACYPKSSAGEKKYLNDLDLYCLNLRSKNTL